jgi:hypothetical protein
MSSAFVIKDVKTELWQRIVDRYKAEGWKVEYEYDQFDKGIDHDFVQLSNGEELILFGWDNWFEGEIQCSDSRKAEMESMFDVSFKMGEPEHLKPDLLEFERRLSKRAAKPWQFWKQQ